METITRQIEDSPEREVVFWEGPGWYACWQRQSWSGGAYYETYQLSPNYALGQTASEAARARGLGTPFKMMERPVGI